jgi:hypothetical protein
VRRGAFGRGAGLVVAGIASALLVIIGAGPASAEHPPIDVQFVSAKLVARGAAVNLTLTVQCDALLNDTNNDQQSFNLNAQITQAVSRTTTTQGQGQFFTDPTQPQEDPFCDGDPTGGPGTLRTVSFYVLPGGGGCCGGPSAPFKKGSALVQANANECNYQCFDNQGQFTQPTGDQMAYFGGFPWMQIRIR